MTLRMERNSWHRSPISDRFAAARGYFVEYLLERPDVKDVWKEFVHHPFVMALGDGSLPRESFKGYIIQEYLHLVSLKAVSKKKKNHLQETSRLGNN